jgi:cell division protein FtsB
MDADELGALYGMALKQQEAATDAINELAKERAQLSATIEALQNTSKSLQKAAGDAAAKAVTETLAQAPKTAQTAFNAAAGALDVAAGKVRTAGAWLTWQFAVVFILVGVAAVLTNYAIGRFTLPDRAEIDALRSEKAELEANIADLAKRGGKIKFNTCSGRICIEASSNQGKDAAGNPATMGSWRTTDGRDVALVIPRGY